MYFTEFCESDDSDGRGQDMLGPRGSESSCTEAARRIREGSPPLLLVYNIPSGRHNSSPSPTASLDLQEEDTDTPIEDWMILGGEEQVGDSSIQLNLSYFPEEEEDSGDEDQDVQTQKDIWAVSKKDKYGGANQSLPSRYFVPGRSQICAICNRTGHLAKSCFYHRKSPTCVLCGVPGHIQRECPCRPCSICGLPSHCPRPCSRPPVWNQHCARCGTAGHLSDACPDTWRQYHYTIQLEVPLRPWKVDTPKYKKHPAHCYNCSRTGHHGYECTKRRMISGTSHSQPFVCHYDTKEDIVQHRTGRQRRTKDCNNAGSLALPDQQHLSEPTKESGEDGHLFPGNSSSTKQETFIRAGRRKTWPERRRERREVKRLRREAQARREGGLLGRSGGNFEVCPTDPFKQCSPPPQKKRREAGKNSRKSRESDRWKKRGGIKHGDLYPHGDVDIDSENSFSPRQRVRHRRR